MQSVGSKNTIISICDKSHLNLTINTYQCGRSEIIPTGSTSALKSDSYYLIYVNEGNGTLEYQGYKTEISKNQGFFVIVDSNFKLTNNSEQSLNIVWVAFTGFLVEEYIKRAGLSAKRPIFNDENLEVSECINYIFDISNTFPNRYSKMTSALYKIFGILLDNVVLQYKLDHDSVFNTGIKPVIDYIEENYANEISIEDLAGVMGISRNHLHNLFQKILGISPKKYLIYYRIDKACRLLKINENQVSDVAYQVGYTNQFYFSKEFKRCVGVTPSEFRKSPNSEDLFNYSLFAISLENKQNN